jgi:hypothetical protein
MEKLTTAQQGKLQKSTIYKKIDVYSFWDSQGPVLDYQERGTTMNSAQYSEILTDRLYNFISGFCILLRVLYQGYWKNHPSQQLFKLNS